MFAVFAMDCGFLGKNDDHVFLFDDAQAALAWRVEKLIEHGEIKRDGDAYKIGFERYETAVDALEAWLDGCLMMQYFHGYEVIDLRASGQPKFVRLPRDVRGDFPIGHEAIARAGVYEAHRNQHGAVSVKAENGKLLGIKPGEYEPAEDPNATASDASIARNE